MPRGDGTGPIGTGPMGRGRNGCLGYRQGFGYGGCGFRGGFGRRYGIAAIAPETLEKQAARLEEQAANLRSLARQKRKDE